MIDILNASIAMTTGMSEEQVDHQDEEEEVAQFDTHNAILQDVKGHKVLATPAVRKIAMENNVSDDLEWIF